MKMRKLPSTDLIVSELCLGTMTYGEQNSKDEAFQQLDVATKEYGINFIDTAESYPVPSAPSTSGATESILGEWLKKGGKKRRQEVVISTKICGFSDQITWCRENGEGTRVTKEQVMYAVDAQLKRLGTDYIDLLQIHWPDRYVPLYGSPEYKYEMERADATPIRAQLEIMSELIKSGKVRHYGLSNETPYGVTTFTTMADMLGLPRPSVTQNVYNLLVRNEFETGMLEACSPLNANVGLLAYSPLAGGALTGKYLDPKKVSQKARMRQFVGFMHRYVAPPAMEAVRRYQEVADAISMPLTPMALAWVYTRPFVTATIIGATNLQQLEDNVMALNMPISEEVARLINDVYRLHLDPTKGVFPVVDPNLEYIDPSKLPWGAKDQDVDPELDVLINQRLSKF
jgi:aryl-alcohol dehydrogenase-like predicted oxidoreductase